MREPLARVLVIAWLVGCGGSPGNGDDAPGDGGPTGDGGTDSGIVEPPPVCTPPVTLVDTSSPTTVVGTGTAESCTEAALAAAVSAGGIVTFDCGAAPATIMLTASLVPPLDRDTVIDGGGTVTLDGGDAVRLIELVRQNYRTSNITLTLQRLRLQHGRAPGTGYVEPSTSNPKCAYGYREGGGGAVLVRDNKLVVIDSEFAHNAAATPGPDIGGGAIYALGSLGITIVGSSFHDNSGSNAGAVGLLQSNGTFVNSSFTANVANGMGQNFAGGDAQGCPGVGHANQGGAGGNGGAIAIDGSDDTDQVFCGVVIADNMANELGGALFRTANVSSRKTHIERSVIRDNQAKSAGAMYLRNSKPLEIYASTFTGNRANGAGMAQLDECTLDVVNTTIHGNRATNGIGGAISNFFGTTGTFTNVTFAENLADGGSGLFSAAIAGQMNFTFRNTLFWNQRTMDAGSPMTCGFTPATGGGNNLQWPMKKIVGTADDTPCVAGITFADAMLGPLGDHGGPTPTLVPMAGSPALGAGTNCPATDQRGMPRASGSCTIGAVE
ncbi:MAG: right-handed parallel beta-helix repeat-containing protein [Kofleriaceae bacterium]|nr:right-handed parallel beta-helix repeat-containing protein [Kofleriaceae bacterium]